MNSGNSQSQGKGQIKQPSSIWRLRESTQKKDSPQHKTVRHSKTEGIHQPFVKAAEYHAQQAQKFIKSKEEKPKQSSSVRVAVQAPRKVVQHEVRTGPVLATSPERQEQLRNAQWSSVHKTSTWSRNLDALGPRLSRKFRKLKTFLRSRTPKVTTPKPNIAMNRMQAAFVAAGFIVFAGGVAVAILGLRTNYEVAAQTQNIQSGENNASPDAPDENNKPDDRAVGSHKVAPDEPKRIMISKLKVNSRIFSMGVKADNQLDTPKNIYDTGWYRASSKPGERGAMLIDGHVSGRKNPGVFSGIHKLSQGDTISVERGDGKVFNYEVVNTKEYEANNTDMLAAVMPVVPGKQGLNLITCSGQLDSKTFQYSHRTIVFATLKD